MNELNAVIAAAKAVKALRVFPSSITAFPSLWVLGAERSEIVPSRTFNPSSASSAYEPRLRTRN
jgi:hypothetical protein